MATEPDLSYLTVIDTNPSFTEDSMSPLLQNDFTHLSFGFTEMLTVSEEQSTHIQVTFDASQSLMIVIPKVSGEHRLMNSNLYFRFPRESITIR